MDSNAVEIALENIVPASVTIRGRFHIEVWSEKAQKQSNCSSALKMLRRAWKRCRLIAIMTVHPMLN